MLRKALVARVQHEDVVKAWTGLARLVAIMLAFVVVSQKLDDATLANRTVRAFFYHATDLVPQRCQPRDLVVDIGQVSPGDDIGLGAEPVGLVGQVE